MNQLETQHQIDKCASVTTPARLSDLLESLYRRQIESSSTSYLKAHSHRNSIHRQVDVFGRYWPHVKNCQTILDWGCNHAPDAAMLRQAMGSGVALHGCDFAPPEMYSVFHQFAGLEYAQLDNPLKIPYANATFDAVIGSGVLEHVAMVGESLKELHRIIVEGGVLVISFLPNRFSYSEFLGRRFGSDSHRRRFGKSEATRLMLHYGFDPIAVGYHQIVPAQRHQTLFRNLWPFDRVLSRIWPVRCFSANLMLICIRRSSM